MRVAYEAARSATGKPRSARTVVSQALSEPCLREKAPATPRSNCCTMATHHQAGRRQPKLAADALQHLLAPGDVLFMKGFGRLQEIGNAGGFLGHVLLVAGIPFSIQRNSQQAKPLQAFWPPGDVEELWLVSTIECTRRAPGLHEAETLLYVDGASRQLLLLGEVNGKGDLLLCEPREVIDIWQSPGSLRAQLRLDLMLEVLADMREHQSDWSARTAAKALLRSARLPHTSEAGKLQLLEDVKACWLREPICTSVVIIFWQRYLCRLAGAVNSNGVPGCSVKPMDLILRWMPLKADCGLPGDLLAAMRDTGWVPLSHVPRMFQAPSTQQASHDSPDKLAEFDSLVDSEQMWDPVEWDIALEEALMETPRPITCPLRTKRQHYARRNSWPSPLPRKCNARSEMVDDVQAAELELLEQRIREAESVAAEAVEVAWKMHTLKTRL
mmetsp:Transcript_93932/g.166210  ORF Transcript_93932/g.166210 Transcript_93932/m.166210 type:complete len:442 (+) Transcript_93932:79-1404(+)